MTREQLSVSGRTTVELFVRKPLLNIPGRGKLEKPVQPHFISSSIPNLLQTHCLYPHRAVSQSQQA